MRPARLLAIARADWAVELGGRQGFVIPGLLVALLAGPAASPSLSLPLRGFKATGDVPAEVAAMPQTDDGVELVFARDAEGHLTVDGPVPDRVRDALDGESPSVERIAVGGVPALPGRTVTFGLISASTLSGAVASSLGGERQRRTLGVLLGAAVSRAEIVAGKALAWAALGLVSVGGAAVVSLLLGRVEPGWWLLPMCTLPLSTVALGLWLVRRAVDVMSGTATSMRVLPAAVSLTGLLAFVLGAVSPYWGALVPIGGALIASGDTWAGPVAPLLATASNLAFSAAAIALTVRDLEEHPSEGVALSPAWTAALAAVFGAVAVWLPVVTPLLYAEAGNTEILARVPVAHGAAAAAACLLGGTALYLARTPGASIPVARPTWAWLGLVPAAVVSAWVHHAPVAPLGWPSVADRLHAASATGGLVGVLTVFADELLFRGWLNERVGWLAAVVVAVIVRAPLDPVGGLAEAAALTGLARLTGSVWPGVIARLLVLVTL